VGLKDAYVVFKRSRGVQMIVGVLLIKAIIAILAVIMLWPNSSPRLKKLFIVLIATAYMASAILESVQSRRSAKESGKTTAVQNEMKNDLSTLKTNSEKDREAKEAETEHRQAIVAQLSTLIVKGTDTRDTCQGILPTPNEKTWMDDVEKSLRPFSLPDAREFLNSSEIIPQQSCFMRIGAHISVLEKIMHKYD
jgi:hypothetical protein